MHKRFFCGNDIFNHKHVLTSDKKLIGFAMLKEEKPISDAIAYDNLIKNNTGLRDKLTKIKTTSLENIKIKEKLVSDFVAGKTKEVEYGRKRLIEIREKAQNTKIKLLQNNLFEKIEQLDKSKFSRYDAKGYTWDKTRALDDFNLSQKGDYAVFPKLIPYKMSSIKHGFSGFIFEKDEIKYVAFTLHTSKETFNLFNLEIPNIKIKDAYSPIQYVNPMHFMELETFKQLFTIESPMELLTKGIFAKHCAHDAMYLALKAGLTSTTQGGRAILLIRPTKQFEDSYVVNSVFFENEGKIFTPAEVIAANTNLDFEKEFVEGVEYVNKIREDYEGKVGLITIAQTVYEDNF